MPGIHPVSSTRYASRKWQRPAGYTIARQDAVAQLTIPELSRAMMVLPIGFVAVGDHFRLCAVQGLAAGKNLLVTPDGRWLGGYIPAVYRAYPFVLAGAENGGLTLCFNEDSGLLVDEESDNEAEGNFEPFFTEDGKPAEGVGKILDFLTQIAKGDQATQQVCNLLQAHGLIQSWPIKVKHADGEQAVQGVYRIDEAALNQLPDSAFLDIRRAGALPVIYAQLYSMQHLSRLGQFAQASAQAEAARLQQSSTGDLDLGFLNDEETISFGKLN